MLYLILAILFSAMISVMMRLSEKYISNDMSMLAMNYVTCSLLSAVYAGPANLVPQVDGFGIALWLGVISGILYLGSFLLLHWNITQNGVVLPPTFMRLGVLVPITMSIVLFREMPGVIQIIGYVGALAAILLIHFDGGSGKANKRWGLIALLIGGGLTDAMAKVYEQMGAPGLKDQYLFYTFLTALVLCVGLILLKKQRLGKMELLFGMLIGIPNYISSRFLLLSLSHVPAVIAYPTYSVGAIIVVSTAGLLLFREKFSKRRTLAMGLILVSLVLLNL